MYKTPLIKLNHFYLKREDTNVTGSAKDRAVSNQVDHLLKQGFSSAVISSTGNAAISACYYCQKNNIKLTIFVSPHINQSKLKLIKQYRFPIVTTTQAKSQAIKYAKQHQAYLLRQSTDKYALLGYQTIGQEIILQLPQVSSIFIATGSGATLWGIAQALPVNVKLFAVQPASNPYIAKLFDTNYQPEEYSLTDALTTKYSPLKQLLIHRLQLSGGGVIVNNNLIEQSLGYLKQQAITTSAESALALAGFFKLEHQQDLGKFPLIIFTGNKR